MDENSMRKWRNNPCVKWSVCLTLLSPSHGLKENKKAKNESYFLLKWKQVNNNWSTNTYLRKEEADKKMTNE